MSTLLIYVHLFSGTHNRHNLFCDTVLEITHVAFKRNESSRRSPSHRPFQGDLLNCDAELRREFPKFPAEGTGHNRQVSAHQDAPVRYPRMIHAGSRLAEGLLAFVVDDLEVGIDGLAVTTGGCIRGFGLAGVGAFLRCGCVGIHGL